jgi:iron complex outermembrane receptor protein
MKQTHLWLLALIATAAHAETPPAKTDTQPTTMPTVTVTATAESLTAPTQQQAEQTLKQVAGGTSVTDAETYKTGRAVTLKDALDFTPGVFTQPRFGSEEARISVRGSGIQRTFHGRGLKIMQDGVPLNLADGGFDMQAIDPLAADFIEVYRGANALRYGATTLGGAINFMSPTGYTAPSFQARFEYGSFNTFRGQLSNAGVDGKFDWYATTLHSSTDGFRDHSTQLNERFFSNFGYKISDDVETRFYLSYVHTDSELPGNLTREQLSQNPQQAQRNPFFRIFDYVDSNWKRDFDMFRIANKTTWKLDADSEFNLSSYYFHKELDHPILFVIDQKSNDFGFDFNYHNHADVGGRRNDFTLGFAPTFGFLHDQRYFNVLGSRGAKFADDETFSANLDLYLENVHYLTDKLAFVAGASVSYAVRNNDDKFAPSLATSSNSVDQDYWGFSPKLGLLYDVNDNAQVFFNASRSFEPPSFGELSTGSLSNVDIAKLDAQTATTLEAGTRGSTANGRVKWDLAYYFAWIDDELMQYATAPGLTQTVNGGRTLHQGVELGLEVSLLEGLFAKPIADSTSAGGKSAKAVQPVAAKPGDRLVFRQNYLWNHFRFDNDSQFGDNQMPGIPEHYYRAELLYEHPSGFYAGPNLEWVFTDYPVDSANTANADSYALLGFKVGYRTKKGLSFYVEARNLTDEHYAATTDVMSRFNPFSPAVYSPGDGRSVFFGMEYKF